MSAPVIPPGGTIVQTFKQSFTNVSIDADKANAIDTTQFLDAAESLTTMFGMLSTGKRMASLNLCVRWTAHLIRFFRLA